MYRYFSRITPAALVFLVPLVCGPDALCGVLPFGGKITLHYITVQVHFSNIIPDNCFRGLRKSAQSVTLPYLEGR